MGWATGQTLDMKTRISNSACESMSHGSKWLVRNDDCVFLMWEKSYTAHTGNLHDEMQVIYIRSAGDLHDEMAA